MSVLTNPSKLLPPTTMLTEFKRFAMRGNVIDLAVGVVIGAAFTGIVNSVVSDIFNPLFGLVIGGIDFSNLFVVIKHGKDGALHYDTLKAAQDAAAVTINYGLFINAIIKFLIVAFAVFMMVRGLNKLLAAHVASAGEEAKTPPPPPSPTEVLLAEIRDQLKKANGEPVPPKPAGQV